MLWIKKRKKKPGTNRKNAKHLGKYSKIKENISKLIHTRFNEEGPWPDAAKSYEDLIRRDI